MSIIYFCVRRLFPAFLLVEAIAFAIVLARILFARKPPEKRSLSSIEWPHRRRVAYPFHEARR
jgi:hypothetical protein